MEMIDVDSDQQNLLALNRLSYLQSIVLIWKVTFNKILADLKTKGKKVICHQHLRQTNVIITIKIVSEKKRFQFISTKNS